MVSCQYAQVAQRQRHTAQNRDSEGSNPSLGTKEKIMSIIVEIRAAEGGDDSKLLVEDQVSIYTKVAARECL